MKLYDRISDLRRDLDAGLLTCPDLVRYYLSNIREHSDLNAFLEVWEEEALHRAQEIDAKIKNGTAGRLAGVVIALKDVLCYAGHKVSSSSKILEGFESLFTATAVQRLLDEDAIFIGRTNCDEFAMGASNENSAFGVVKNAIDKERVPGGSSGGSAAAVQARLCHAALGTDTGGSIRQPASFTGIYGFKPTYGRISRWGLLAYASSFDQIGPLTRSLEDAALLTEIMAGPDGHDATCSNKEVPNYRVGSAEKKWRIAWMQEALEHEGVDPEIRAYMYTLIEKLKQAGHELVPVSFDLLDYMVPAYYVLTTAEASSNLSRYSGLLYGYRDSGAKDLESTFVLSRTNGFGEEVKRRIMLGTFVLGSDYYDAYYSKGQKVRRLIREKTEAIFNEYDAFILPTTSTPAFKLGEKSKDPIAMYLADLFTVQANLAGNPAISLPLGHTKNGLPFGVQVMAGHFQEQLLFDASAAIQKTAETP